MSAEPTPPFQHDRQLTSTAPYGPGASAAAGDDLNLAQILQVGRRRIWIILGVAITVTSSAWAWTLTQTPIYQGGFRVLVESASTTDRSQQLLQEAQGNARSSFDYGTQIEVLRSPTLLRPVVEELRQTFPEVRYESLVGNLMISRLRDTQVLAISYRDPNSEKIAAVLDAVSNQYLAYSLEQRQTSLQQGIQFVENQLPELRGRVDTLQVELEQFRQRYSLINPEARGSDLSSLISGVEQAQQETQTQLTEAQSLYNTLQNQLGFAPDQALAASALSESSRYQNLLNQIRQIEAQIATESTRFQPDTPNIQVLQDERNNLLPLLQQEAAQILGNRLPGSANGNLTATSLDLNRQLIGAANQIQVLQSRAVALTEVERQLKQEFALVPALSRQYTDLQRELGIATESLNRFLTTQETLQIEAAQKSAPWELISEPSVSGAPVSPNVPRNLLMGAIAGLILGMTAALLAEKLDTVFHSPDELKESTKLPLLGVIPFEKHLQDLHSTAGRTGRSKGYQNGQSGDRAPLFVTAMKPHAGYGANPFLESFRSLHANIRFLGSDGPIRSLVISSALPSEGKSTTATHLAKAAAAMGQRVLLVDADLRCPQVHSRLNLPNLRGLSNVITHSLDPTQAIQSVPQDENLFVLTSGPIPPDPLKILSSQSMLSLMQDFQHQFDLIIYDMPPLLGFADSSLVAAHTEGLILVVGLGRTDRSALTQAIDTLRISPVSILGLVANGIKSYTIDTYGHYRYRRYYARQVPSPDPEPSASRLDLFQVKKSNGFNPALAQADHPFLDSVSLSSELTHSSSSRFSRMRFWQLLIGGTALTALLVFLSWKTYLRLSGNLEETQAQTSNALANFPQERDPFVAAIQIAQESVTAGKAAQTSEEWFTLSTRWQQASELMTVVPADDERYEMAQDRVQVYRSNSEYARRKAEEAIAQRSSAN